tara:strand:- start:283 stop:531 length:249 start_codon:yes stop_codon:yes gene_type:complete
MNPDNTLHNNEWLLSKPTPMGDTEEWWFVPVTDKGVISAMEIHHKPENDIMYCWSLGSSLDASRIHWNNLVEQGYVREAQIA